MLCRALYGGAPVKGCLCGAGASVEAGHLTTLQLGCVACNNLLQKIQLYYYNVA